MAKIKELVIRDEETRQGSSHLAVKIDDSENLVLEGHDTGQEVAQVWGDSDYEYWLTVQNEYKDTILLWLIHENFDSASAFQHWLKDKDIPSDFNNHG